jgi:4-hydroxy-2-oxoheptanedioate aldolase
MNRVREIWDGGGQAVGAWLQIGGALSAETIAGCGFDTVVIDLQHSLIDFSTCAAMLLAIEKQGVEPIVRMHWNEPAAIMKILDAGAYGVVAPMIETAEEARAFADCLHYPPHGKRSWGPRRPLIRYGRDYAAQASASVVSMAMIETRRGLDNLDAILAVDGLDGIFIGPADLALALGRAPRADHDDPEVVATIADIRERTHAAGRKVGIFTAAPAFSARKLRECFDLVTITPDLMMLEAAARRTLAEVREAARRET